jgi:hypothetical protein
MKTTTTTTTVLTSVVAMTTPTKTRTTTKITSTMTAIPTSVNTTTQTNTRITTTMGIRQSATSTWRHQFFVKIIHQKTMGPILVAFAIFLTTSILLKYANGRQAATKYFQRASTTTAVVYNSPVEDFHFCPADMEKLRNEDPEVTKKFNKEDKSQSSYLILSSFSSTVASVMSYVLSSGRFFFLKAYFC